MVAELRRLKAEPLAPGELQRAKDHLKGSLMLGLESTSSRMSHLARQEIYGDTDESLDDMLAAIDAVTDDDVRRGSRIGCSRRATLGLTVLGGGPAADHSAPSSWRWHDSRATPTPRWAASGPSSAATRRGSQVELAAADAMAAAGLVPAEAARELRGKAAFDIARIEEIEKTTQHDVIAFTTAVAEHVGPVGPLAALRPDLVGRGRHRAGAADGRGDRPRSCGCWRRCATPSRRAPTNTAARR